MTMRVNTAQKNSDCSPFLYERKNNHALLRAWAADTASNLARRVMCIVRAHFDVHSAVRLEALSDSQLRDIGLRRHQVEQIDPRAPIIF